MEIVDVLFDEKLENIQKMTVEDKASWPFLCDFKGWFSNDALLKYRISSIPTTFLLDEKGIIVSSGLQWRELDKRVRELIK